MRKLILLFGFAITLATGITAPVTGAEESELDTDLMQNIEDTNKSLSSNIALQRADASKSDAKDLSAMFDVVEAHFVKKNARPMR